MYKKITSIISLCFIFNNLHLQAGDNDNLIAGGLFALTAIGMTMTSSYQQVMTEKQNPITLTNTKPQAIIQISPSTTNISDIKEEQETINLQESIPLLMDILTREIHTMPETILTEQDIKSLKVQKQALYLTTSITTGPSYELCNAIIEKNEFLKNQNISFRQLSFIADCIGYVTGFGACVIANNIITGSLYYRSSDASKLFTIHHELQHQINGDTNIRNNTALYNNKSPLADLVQNPDVKSILKPDIKNAQGQNLQAILKENGPSLKKEVSRYREYRADTGALHSIDCPYCLEEYAQRRSNNPEIDPAGYLRQWQFEPRIKELEKKSTICQHHHENGEQIDTSITDESTLMKRLKIIQK